MKKLHTDMKQRLWMRLLPTAWHPYVYLGRYDRPSAIWLLFFPCLWSFALFGLEAAPLKVMGLFFLGAVLVRAGGCIINDMADQRFDRGVERTRGRPLAAGTLNFMQSLMFLMVHLVLALWVLICFNQKTILMGVCIVPLIILYPFMKRWTYWPQVFLGVVFNVGVLMVWMALSGTISLSVFLVYGAAVFWTVGYDTIYGLQDLLDDSIVGVKSMAVRFQGRIGGVLGLCFALMLMVLGAVGVLSSFGWVYYGGLMGLGLLLIFQALKVQTGDPEVCLAVFKAQKYIGFLVFLLIVIGKL